MMLIPSLRFGRSSHGADSASNRPGRANSSIELSFSKNSTKPDKPGQLESPMCRNQFPRNRPLFQICLNYTTYTLTLVAAVPLLVKILNYSAMYTTFQPGSCIIQFFSQYLFF